MDWKNDKIKQPSGKPALFINLMVKKIIQKIKNSQALNQSVQCTKCSVNYKKRGIIQHQNTCDGVAKFNAVASTALVPGECNICHVKYSKRGLANHQAKCEKSGTLKISLTSSILGEQKTNNECHQMLSSYVGSVQMEHYKYQHDCLNLWKSDKWKKKFKDFTSNKPAHIRVIRSVKNDSDCYTHFEIVQHTKFTVNSNLTRVQFDHGLNIFSFDGNDTSVVRTKSQGTQTETTKTETTKTETTETQTETKDNKSQIITKTKPQNQSETKQHTKQNVDLGNVDTLNTPSGCYDTAVKGWEHYKKLININSRSQIGFTPVFFAYAPISHYFKHGKFPCVDCAVDSYNMRIKDPDQPQQQCKCETNDQETIDGYFAYKNKNQKNQKEFSNIRSKIRSRAVQLFILNEFKPQYLKQLCTQNMIEQENRFFVLLHYLNNDRDRMLETMFGFQHTVYIRFQQIYESLITTLIDCAARVAIHYKQSRSNQLETHPNPNHIPNTTYVHNFFTKLKFAQSKTITSKIVLIKLFLQAKNNSEIIKLCRKFDIKRNKTNNKTQMMSSIVNKLRKDNFKIRLEDELVAIGTT